jgi:SAM-dependent methyltransferase
MTDSQSALDHWNRAAAVYSHSRGSGPLALCSLYEPSIEQLLGNVTGKQILDAGCGDGHYARVLKGRGALVSAIDGASQMIALARRAGHDGIAYQVADLTQRLPFDDESQDIVLANMVLMDIPTIEIAVEEFARILRRRGALVFAITHPCFFCSDWVQEGGVNLHKAVADYLSVRTESLELWGRTLHFHRPLSAYFEELECNGFAVDALKEPRPSEEQVREHPEWEHHLRIPSFIVARAIRL